MKLVVPDETKSIAQGAIEPWSKPHYRSHLGRSEARRAPPRHPDDRALGRSSPKRNGASRSRATAPVYAGIRGFFSTLEKKKYKVHVRVFLSRYRGYRAVRGLRRDAPPAGGP